MDAHAMEAKHNSSDAECRRQISSNIQDRLVEACADEKNIKEVHRLIRELGANPNKPRSKCPWDTPLMNAAANGQIRIVICLVQDHHVKVEKTDFFGENALHKASFHGELDVVRYLNRFKSLNQRDGQGATPFLKAAAGGQIEAVKYFIERGADVNSSDENGRTALHKACAVGNIRLVNLLIRQGAKVNHRDNDHETCLHVAAFYGHPGVVQLVLDKHALVNVENSRGETPLHRAALGNHLQVIHALSCKGADVNHQDVFGQTPLHKLALKNDDVDPMERVLAAGYLFSRDADPFIKDKCGESSLELALSNNYQSLASRIILCGKTQVGLESSSTSE